MKEVKSPRCLSDKHWNYFEGEGASYTIYTAGVITET